MSTDSYQTTDRTTDHDSGKASIADLFRDLKDEVVTLTKQEITLAKTEAGEKVSRVTRNAGYAAAGGAVLLVGALLLLIALANLVSWVADALGVDPNWLSGAIGYGVVGLIVAIVGYAVYRKGAAALNNESAMPQETLRSLNEDKQWIANKRQ